MSPRVYTGKIEKLEITGKFRQDGTTYFTKSGTRKNPYYFYCLQYMSCKQERDDHRSSEKKRDIARNFGTIKFLYVQKRMLNDV